MPTYLYGKVIDFDTVNKNNRLYPKDEVLKAVDEFNKKSVKLSEVFPSTRERQINLDHVGAKCDKLMVVDDSLYAQLEIIPSTAGTKLINQLSEHTNPQFMLSVRGYVSPLVNENSVLTVKDLDIISIDVLPFDGSDQSMICQVQKCPNK